MKHTKKISALFVGMALTAAPAMAADENVTALIAASNSDTGSALSIYELPGLPDVDTCLNTAWVMSIRPPQWNYGRGVTVQCMKNHRIEAAQTCYAGECRAITIPGGPK
jgi:hypothetical protein